MAQFYNVNNEDQVQQLAHNKEDEVSFIWKTQRNLGVHIISMNEDEIVFDLIGADASIANALRRIILSEVPTVAIENVWITANSGLIQDEVLAHRVGLVPIKVDPRRLQYVKNDAGETDEDTLVFHLNVHFPQGGEEESNVASGSSINVGPSGNVYSKHLTWLPIGSQNEIFPEGVAAVHPDIVLAKLRPGQALEFEAHCRKGIGRDHAKFQPVATVSYRLAPEILVADEVMDGLANELVSMCPMGVFDIEEIGNNMTKAKVTDARKCTMCRECIRKPGWDARVDLRRKANHFIFTVESVGALSPEEIVKEAIGILRAKTEKLNGDIDMS
jgi:DNA-directed RNA polymerase I and III subunit RPAC1